MPQPISPSAIEAYFQHSIDIELAAQKVSIFANLLFRNNTKEIVEDPEILIHLSPSTSSELSGKILSPSMTKVYATYTRGGNKEGWQFKDEDWFIQGKKTGLYRIVSVEPLRLAPDVWTELNGIQIDCDLSKLSGTFQASAQIRTSGGTYTIKNPICILSTT
jgi:hypothetical protein